MKKNTVDRYMRDGAVKRRDSSTIVNVYFDHSFPLLHPFLSFYLSLFSTFGLIRPSLIYRWNKIATI